MNKNRVMEEKGINRFKFRAWDKNTKEMCWVDTWNPINMQVRADRKNSKLYTLACSENHSILMQFTGLLDKAGKEVFEGDIFDIGQTVNGQSRFVIMNCIGEFDVRYAYDLNRKYEYSVKELLKADDIKIVGHVFELAPQK